MAELVIFFNFQGRRYGQMEVVIKENLLRIRDMGEDCTNGQTERYSLICVHFLIDWAVYIFTDHVRSTREGDVFPRMCDSVYRGGGEGKGWIMNF